MQTIEPELQAVLERMRRQILESARVWKLTSYDLAEIGGIAEGSARIPRHDPFSWKPSVKILTRLERGLAAVGKLVSVPGTGGAVVARQRRSGETEDHSKAYLAESAEQFDPQLSKVARYWKERRSGDRVRESDIRMSTVRTFAPDCAAHIFDVEFDSQDAVICDWKRLPDYMNGADLTGARVREQYGALMAECLIEDLLAVADTGWPMWCAVRRSFAAPGWATPEPGRNYLRGLFPLEGSGDHPKVLAVRRLQEPASSLQFLGDLRPAAPE